MNLKQYCCFLSDEGQSKYQYGFYLYLLNFHAWIIIILVFQLFLFFFLLLLGTRTIGIIHGKRTPWRSCSEPQTIFIKIIRSERVDLEVFILVEQVKAFRQNIWTFLWFYIKFKHGIFSVACHWSIYILHKIWGSE